MFKTKNYMFELAGWYGTAAILLAYILVSFDVLDADGVIFQILNLTGALGVIAIAAHKKVTQSVVLNIFWACVAIIALFRLFI